MLGLGGRRREHMATATACLLTTAVAIILLLGSDVYEFSWRYQLPALVLLPPAGILGAAAIAASMRDAAPERAADQGERPAPGVGAASTPAAIQSDLRS
jgi:hypothetical protein